MTSTPTRKGNRPHRQAPRTAANKGQLSPWSPTEKQRVYLIHLIEGYATGTDITDRALAEKINVHNTTISHWRECAEFETWVNGAFDRFVAGGMKKLLVRAWSMAIRGSVKHMEFFAKYSGQAPQTARPGHDCPSTDDRQEYSFNILIPRPPDELPPSGGGA